MFYAELSFWIGIGLPVLSLLGCMCWLRGRAPHRLALANSWLSFLCLFTSAFLQDFEASTYALQSNWSMQGGFFLNPMKFHLTPLGWAFLLTTTALACIINHYSAFALRHLSTRAMNGYYACLSAFTLSVCLFVVADHLFVSFLAWTWMGIMSYALISFYGTSSARLATHVLWWNKVADMGFLLAIALWTAAEAAPSILSMSLEVPRLSQTMRWLCVAAWSLSALLKSAQVPLHGWLLWAMKGPNPVSAYLHSATLVACGLWWMIRIQPILTPSISTFILLIGLLSALWGSYRALQQTHIKALLAYSTIAQIGYAFILLARHETQYALALIIGHACAKAYLFIATGIITAQQKAPEAAPLSRLGAYANSRAIPYLCATLATLSLLGTPFTVGYISKKYLIHSLDTYPYLIGLAIAFALTAGYTARILLALWNQYPKPNLTRSPFRLNAHYLTASGLVVLSALAIAYPIQMPAPQLKNPWISACVCTAVPLALLALLIKLRPKLTPWLAIQQIPQSITQALYTPLVNTAMKIAYRTSQMDEKYQQAHNFGYQRVLHFAKKMKHWNEHTLISFLQRISNGCLQMAQYIQQSTQKPIQNSMRGAWTLWLIIGFVILLLYLIQI